MFDDSQRHHRAEKNRSREIVRGRGPRGVLEQDCRRYRPAGYRNRKEGVDCAASQEGPQIFEVMREEFLVQIADA